MRANVLLRASFVILSLATLAARQTPAPSFSITISTTESTVKVGSKVAITILFKNISQEEVDLAKIPGDHGGEFHNVVDVRDADGKLPPETEYKQELEGRRSTVNGHHVLPLTSNFTQFLKPGDLMQDSLVITNLYDLSKPGKYTIQIERSDDVRKTVVKSNVITVTVAP
jgi:hypothetical protein